MNLKRFKILLALVVAVVCMCVGAAFAQARDFDSYSRTSQCDLSGVCEKFGERGAKYLGALEFFARRYGQILWPWQYDPDNSCVRIYVEDMTVCKGVEPPPRVLPPFDSTEGPGTIETRLPTEEEKRIIESRRQQNEGNLSTR
jgi:hypothetical protein